jgi:hypothetical protein
VSLTIVAAPGYASSARVAGTACHHPLGNATSMYRVPIEHSAGPGGGMSRSLPELLG